MTDYHAEAIRFFDIALDRTRANGLNTQTVLLESIACSLIALTEMMQAANA